MPSRLLCSVLLASTLMAAQAEPYVIYDAGSGVGVSTEPYLQLFMAGEETPDFRQSWLFEIAPSERMDEPRSTFPLRSSMMTPGYMEQSVTGLMQFPYPLCIVGSDDLSLEWAESNIDRLTALNTQCLLVSADSLEEAKPVLQVLQGLLVYPADGDGIARELGLRHYPVLIYRGEASQ